MFWGLIMEPGRCYTQTVKVSFHVSMAALDISTSSDEPAQVMCVFEGRNYLLCTLNKKDQIQCALDLNFEEGSKVSFATNGKSHVHLTGYLTAFDEDDEQEEEEEEAETVKEKNRPKRKVDEGPPAKKPKNALAEEEEEESSDSDFDVEKCLNKKGIVEEDSGEEEEDPEVESGEEEEDGDENAEEEEEEGAESSGDEDEASSLSEEDESEEEATAPKPKQNGVTKPNATQKQKNKKQQQPVKTPSKEQPKKQEPKEKQQKQRKTILKGGVTVQDLREGVGEAAKTGKFVHVYYEGRLKDNNKVFDSTIKGPGFSFRIGKGEVIKGWDIGLVGMKAGGKRRIICPASVAYGAKGSPPVIPPNATLVFDVELKKVS